MAAITIRDVYTRRVSGETYVYEAEYTTGNEVVWLARVFLDGDLKGTPGGKITGNVLEGDALRTYVISFIENIIERGLGIDE